MSQDLMIVGTIFLLGYMQSALADEPGVYEGIPRHHTEMQREDTGAHSSQEKVQRRGGMKIYGSERINMSGESPEMGDMKGAFLKKKTVDGYQLSFHVMKAAGNAEHSGAYQFMLKVEQGGHAIRNLMVNSKVRHPNNQSESKMMMKMGDWYSAGYDLTHPGDHELIVLFKAKDGSKHFASVYYPVVKQE